MQPKFFIQFYEPKTKTNSGENLTDRVITQSLVQSMQISADFIQAQGKTITIVLKNPRNIFNSDYEGNSSNIFGEPITHYDWRSYLVPDGQFFVAKGSKDEWDTLSDDDKTKRLMGIFRIDKVTSQMVKQTITITGQDLMKFPIRGVAYHNTGDVWQYPPNDWADEQMSVGQIVHDVFHKMGVYHYHKDGHIDNDSNGPLTPDGDIFYSTNMYFSPAVEKSDEQIFDLVHPYDFIKKFCNYTGYLFYVKEKVINDVPRAVFYFTPPDYNDDTQTLLGSAQISLYNPPVPNYHRNPIKVLSIQYGLDDNNIRGYVITSTADENAIVENTGQSGSRMRDKSWMIGVIKQPDIKDLKDSNGDNKSHYAQAIGQAVMSQIMHLYRSLKIQFNDWIKFGQHIYNMDINSNNLNIHINDNYLCKSVTWSYNKFLTTTANFSYFSVDDIPKVKPVVYYTPGDRQVGIYFPQVGADSYIIYQDYQSVKTKTPTNGQPIDEVITGLTNGQTYTFYVGAIYYGQEVDSDPTQVTPNPNDSAIGGGNIHVYD